MFPLPADGGDVWHPEKKIHRTRPSREPQLKPHERDQPEQTGAAFPARLGDKIVARAECAGEPPEVSPPENWLSVCDRVATKSFPLRAGRWIVRSRPPSATAAAEWDTTDVRDRPVSRGVAQARAFRGRRGFDGRRFAPCCTCCRSPRIDACGCARGATGRGRSIDSVVGSGPPRTGSSARPSTCSASISRASGPAPDPHRLRLHRASVPQGLPADRQRRGPVRPGEATRRLRARRQHRAARAWSPKVIRHDDATPGSAEAGRRPPQSRPCRRSATTP